MSCYKLSTKSSKVWIITAKFYVNPLCTEMINLEAVAPKKVNCKQNARTSKPMKSNWLICPLSPSSPMDYWRWASNVEVYQLRKQTQEYAPFSNCLGKQDLWTNWGILNNWPTSRNLRIGQQHLGCLDSVPPKKNSQMLEIKYVKTEISRVLREDLV